MPLTIDKLKISKFLITDQIFYLFISTVDHHCLISGREHQSNFIWFFLDMKNKVLFQNCYDTECKKKGRKLLFSINFESNETIFDNSHHDALNKILENLLKQLLTI